MNISFCTVIMLLCSFIRALHCASSYTPAFSVSHNPHGDEREEQLRSLITKITKVARAISYVVMKNVLLLSFLTSRTLNEMAEIT